MRHLRVGRRLSRRPDQRRAMLRQLIISMILEGRIRTTVARAKELRRHLERLVTHAKKGDLAHFRLVLSRLGNHREAARRLFYEIAPKFHGRPGGYLRILKLLPRSGDASPLAWVEWVSEEKKPGPSQKPGTKAEKKKEEGKLKGDEGAHRGQRSSREKEGIGKKEGSPRAATKEEESKEKKSSRRSGKKSS